MCGNGAKCTRKAGYYNDQCGCSGRDCNIVIEGSPTVDCQDCNIKMGVSPNGRHLISGSGSESFHKSSDGTHIRSECYVEFS